MTQKSLREIGSVERTACPGCSAAGHVLYEHLQDRLFSAPGMWRMRRCEDPGCGLLWLDPVPKESDIGAAYRSYYTHAEEPAEVAWRERLIELISASYLTAKLGYKMPHLRGPECWLWPLAYVSLGGRLEFELKVMALPAPSHGGRVLDVGCGNGYMMVRLRERGWETHGVDMDPIAVNQAIQRGVIARIGDVKSQSYPDAWFEAVTLGHVIEHVHNPGDLLDECRRVLQPGGRLVIRTPNADAWGHRHFGQDWRGLEPPRHIQVFTGSSLSRMVERACLRVERSGSIATSHVRYVLDMSRALRKNRVFARPVQWERGSWARLRRIGYQSLERALLLVNSRAAEELFMVARRDL